MEEGNEDEKVGFILSITFSLFVLFFLRIFTEKVSDPNPLFEKD